MNAKTVVFIFSMFFIIHTTNEFQNWRRDRRPKIMGDKIPTKAIIPHRKIVQKRIVLYHNYFRTRVVPKAANMLRMKWHKGAARAAQKWADQCMFLTHDNITGRHTDAYGACGQNIFVSSHKVPWAFAIKTWWLEKHNFTFGSSRNDLKLVGHYTQMVWAASHEVGCGLSRCFRNGNVAGKMYYSYICNYCPIGNRQGQIGRPYKRGRPCGLCRRHCHANRVCTNACPVADLWVNCRELYKVWPNWLCNSPSPMGRERMGNCRATCGCKNKIHD